VVDHLADVWHFDRWKRDGEALATTGVIGTAKVRLLKPQTYMNLSGTVLRPYVRRPFWSASKDLLVVVDDAAIPLGTMRVRAHGSAGGHNGLKSIEAAVGSQEYARLRVGVKPTDEQHRIDELADFVLSSFGRDEREVVQSLLPRVGAAVEMWVRDGAEATMNEYNA